jgi:molybdenum transport protein
MMRIGDDTIEAWIKEDVPYMDLTTHLLDIGRSRGRLSYFARERTVVCGCEESIRVFEKLGIEAGRFIPSGGVAGPGELMLEGSGPASALHEAWRLCVRVLEYASGIASRTRALVETTRSADSKVGVVVTRKCFPGTKELAVKAALAGGALPHRLGLSETVLVFGQHRMFLDEPLEKLLPALKRRAFEKKLIAEAASLEDAERLCAAGIDGVQFDKLEPEELGKAVIRLRAMRPDIVIIAAGGITADNAAAYARAGIDAIATSSIFFGKPADIRAAMERSD